MGKTPPKAEALIREIEVAFSDVPYPGDDDIAIMTCDPSTAEHSVSNLKGKRWQDWKDKPLELIGPGKYHGSLAWLSPRAYVYYLPLFMITCVTHWQGVDIAGDELIWSLGPPTGEIQSQSEREQAIKFKEEKWRGLSLPQIRSVISFLQFIEEEHAVSGLHGYILAVIETMSALAKI